MNNNTRSISPTAITKKQAALIKERRQLRSNIDEATHQLSLATYALTEANQALYNHQDTHGLLPLD